MASKQQIISTAARRLARLGRPEIPKRIAPQTHVRRCRAHRHPAWFLRRGRPNARLCPLLFEILDRFSSGARFGGGAGSRGAEGHGP